MPVTTRLMPERSKSSAAAAMYQPRFNSPPRHARAAVGDGGGREGGEVGAGGGLAEPLAPHGLAGGDPRQVAPLLLLRPVEDDRGADAVRPDTDLGRGAEVGHLFAVDH